MSTSDSLRGRVPGQSVMSEIIARHRDFAGRSALARFFGVSPLAASDRALYRAALGELLVGDALDNLGPEWDVLHVVPVSGVDPEIDHLVIGPAGVFTIRTRNFPGEEIWVAGTALLVGAEQVSDIVDARIEADRAGELLSAAAGQPIAVTPVVVLVNPKKLVIREKPARVEVLSSRYLANWLKSLERTQDGATVALVSDVADRPTTWHTPDTATMITVVPDTDRVDGTGAVILTDTQELHREFASLRDAVSRAASLRVFWGGIAFIVAAGFLWFSVAEFVSHLMRR